MMNHVSLKFMINLTMEKLQTFQGDVKYAK